MRVTIHNELKENKEKRIQEADIKKIIKDLEKGFGTSDDDKAKVLQLFKGLIFSKDSLAKEYTKKLDKATTKISKELSK